MINEKIRLKIKSKYILCFKNNFSWNRAKIKPIISTNFALFEEFKNLNPTNTNLNEPKEGREHDSIYSESQTIKTISEGEIDPEYKIDQK